MDIVKNRSGPANDGVVLKTTTCCQGPGFYSRSKEDRIVVVDDLEAHLISRGIVIENWPTVLVSGPSSDQAAESVVESESKDSDNVDSKSTADVIEADSSRHLHNNDSEATLPADADPSRDGLPTSDAQNTKTSQLTDAETGLNAVDTLPRIPIKVFAGEMSKADPMTILTLTNPNPQSIVFDGHCGAFASTYLSINFPLHLYNAPSFALGDLEAALKEAYASIHVDLLMDPEYYPESPSNDFSSGSTASSVLVTPTKTYFALLGDSPILVWKRHKEGPEMVFKEMDIDNPELHHYMATSGIFLVGIKEGAGKKHTYSILTQEKVKRKAMKSNMYSHDFASRKRGGEHKFDDLRVGMSALNVWGTLGDSIYDVQVYNTLLKELDTYRCESGIGNEGDVKYCMFRSWLVERESWAYLSKHLSLLPLETQMSRVFLTALKALKAPEHYLSAPGLVRVPQTACLPNKDLRLFLVASDGVIRFYDKFRKDYDEVVMRYGERNPTRCVEELKKFLVWIGDDRSVILGNYTHSLESTDSSGSPAGEKEKTRKNHKGKRRRSK